MWVGLALGGFAFVGSPWSENPEKNIEAGQREAGVLKCSALLDQPIVQIAITNKNI